MEVKSTDINKDLVLTRLSLSLIILRPVSTQRNACNVCNASNERNAHKERNARDARNASYATNARNACNATLYAVNTAEKVS